MPAADQARRNLAAAVLSYHTLRPCLWGISQGRRRASSVSLRVVPFEPKSRHGMLRETDVSRGQTGLGPARSQDMPSHEGNADAA